MSGALFGSAATGNRSTGKNLVEFRAGKMSMKGTTVTPDKRKGQVYVHQSDDSLMHFCWKDRGNGVVEDDLIIFPDDCEFKAVTQCTTGRVFVLKFKSSSRKFFFWMQEPKKDKDDEYCKKVNEMLNNPPAPGSSGGGGRSGGLPPELAGLGASLGEGGLQNVLGNMDQQQLMQLLNSGGLGGMGGLGALGGLIGAGRPQSSHQSSSSTAQSRAQSSTAVHSQESSSSTSQPSQTPTVATTKPKATTTNTTTTATASAAATATATATSTNQSVQLSDLQTILNTMNIPVPDGEAGAEGVPQQPPIDLNKVLTSEAMAPILAKPEVQEKLIQFLPEGESLPRDPEQLRQTLKSPQFKQALNMFTAAFQSGQLGPLMGQFGLGSEAAEAANKGDLEAFGKALQKQSGGEKMETETSKDGSDKPKDDEEGMNLD